MNSEDSAAISPWDLLVREVGARAALHRKRAQRFLLSIVAIIAGGIVFFTFTEKILGSQQLTMSELSTQSDAYAGLIEKKKAELEEASKALFEIFHVSVARHDAPVATQLDGTDHAIDDRPQPPWEIDAVSGATMLAETDCPSDGRDLLLVLTRDGISVLGPTNLNRTGCLAVVDTLKDRTEFASVKRTRDQLYDLEESSSIVKTEIARIRALQGTSIPSRDRDGVGSTEARWVQLAETSINRLGTLLMLFFLVSILVPLYRYNIRLSVFYQGFSDALRVVGPSQDRAELVGALTQAFTPTFDFSRQPASPIADLLQATPTRGKSA